MKKILKMMLPRALLKAIRLQRQISSWRRRGFLENSPQSVKENVFLKYGVKDAFGLKRIHIRE